MAHTPLAQWLQGISRRQFLQAAAVAALSPALPLTLPFRTAEASRARGEARIAIVGGGLAGLTCAYRLKQAGYLATVYEATDRLGGRCWTRRGEFAEDQLAEHGGELIDTGHIEIRQLARELGLTLDNLYQAERQGTEPVYYFGGRPYTYAEATDDIKQIWQKVHRDLSEAGYPTLYNRSTPRGRELDAMSIIDWIEESVPGGMGSRLGKLLDVAYNIEYGAESIEQSALNLLYLLGYSGQGRLRIFGPSNEKYHVRGGNDQITARLAAELDGQLESRRRLEAVRRRSDGTYTLVFADLEVTADRVVLALPFSILRSAVDLSQAGFRPLKLTAIAELGMGTNTKLNVQFTDRHWEGLGYTGESFADTGYQATWEVSRGQPGQAGILVNYTGGLVGASFSWGTPMQRAEQFVQQLEPVMPGVTAKFNGHATVDYWTGYRWTRGSYPYWKVGQCSGFAGVEGEPENNCHFAGDHTSIDFQGYLNGAVESGQRAAAEIAHALRGPKHAT